MRQHYAQRRLWIEEALAEQGFVVTLQKGGIQLVIEVEGDDKAQVAKANQAGLAVQALSRWRVVSSGKGAFTVVYQYYFRWHGETGRMAASTGDTVTVSPNGTAGPAAMMQAQSIKYVAIRLRTSLATQAKQRPDKNPHRCGGSYATPGFSRTNVSAHPIASQAACFTRVRPCIRARVSFSNACALRRAASASSFASLPEI